MMTAEGYYDRGVEYEKKGEYDLAIADYTKAVEIDQNYADAYNNRGIAYRESGDFQKAIFNFNYVISRDSSHAMAYSNRGITHDLIRNHELAQRDHAKALELNPTISQRYFEIGNMYSNFHQYGKAIENYTLAIEVYPLEREIDALKYRIARGKTYQALEKYVQAIADFTYVINKIEGLPEYFSAYEGREASRRVLGAENLADEDLKRVNELKSAKSAKEYCDIGNSCFEQKKYDLALENFKRAIEVDPLLPDAYEGSAKTNEALGEIAQAMKDFKKALELRKKCEP